MVRSWGSGAEKLLDVAEDVNALINLPGGVVEIETGPGSGGDAKFFHQRLVAMMPSAQGETALVHEGHDVMGMDFVEEKADQPGPATDLLKWISRDDLDKQDRSRLDLVLADMALRQERPDEAELHLLSIDRKWSVRAFNMFHCTIHKHNDCSAGFPKQTAAQTILKAISDYFKATHGSTSVKQVGNDKPIKHTHSDTDDNSKHIRDTFRSILISTTTRASRCM